jgi:hypothetical protein
MFNNLSLHSCVSMARDKLHSAAAHGPRDNVRLCRWVLLKNSLTNTLTRSTESSPPPYSDVSPTPKSIPPPDLHREPTIEAFLFPDGDVFAESFSADDQFSEGATPEVDLGAEALWLNSLLESLSEENEADGLTVAVPVDDDEEEELDLVSLLDLPSSEDLSISITPESIRLPPSPPLPPSNSETSAFRLYSHDGRIAYSLSELSDDLESLAPPDVIEDSCSDTDSDSIVTPFTRSFSSLAEGAHPSTGAMRPLVHIVDHSASYGLNEEPLHRNLISESYEPQEC